jgi:transcription elongation factor S-II
MSSADLYELKDILLNDDERHYDVLSILKETPIDKKMLQETGLGKIVAKIRDKSVDALVKKKAKELVDLWKYLVKTDSKDKKSDQADQQIDSGETNSRIEIEVDLTQKHSVPITDDPKRDKVRNVLFKALLPRSDADEREPADVAEEIESICFEKLSEKDYFTQIRSIKFNLTDPKNLDFKQKCLRGYFEVDRYPSLKAEDMASQEWNDKRDQVRRSALEECQSDWALRHGNISVSGMFQCGKCKGTKTTYFQMQTRSSDEPMTTFVSCLQCKNRWKFC